MKSVENTRRELFEDTFKKKSLTISLEKAVDLEGDCIYVDDWTQLAWIGFNAALDSVMIEVPPYHELHEMTSGDLYDSVLVSIESTNLGIKVK